MMGASCHNTARATSGRMTITDRAQPRDFRTAQQQNAQAATADSAIHSAGAGTRRSAACTALTRPMMSVIPCNNRAVEAPGSRATQELMREAQNVTMAIGASTATSGTLNMFVGTANIVARWK